MKFKNMISLYLLALTLVSCGGSDDGPEPTTAIDPGNDPNFTIVANTDVGLNSFNRKVVVFGIDIYAVSTVEDEKLLHAANVMAQYLDNDEDGNVDDPNVLSAMQSARAFMVMWKSENDLERLDPPDGREGQDLGNDETRPEWHRNKTGEFDASLEEVWHIISHAGYANAYPDVFGEGAGTTLSNAMDLARGGRHSDIPNPYPAEAWYTYNDQTCDYECQTTEYFYWAITSQLGAQANRLGEIGHEWRLNTSQKLQEGDPAIYQLLTNPAYSLPTILPDGTYKQ